MSDLPARSNTCPVGKSVPPPLSGKGNFGRDSHPFEPIKPPRNRRWGYVYFITDEVTIKIGHSRWPQNRVKNIRSPSGLPMRVLGWYRGFMDEEHSVHRYFDDLLVGGAEWFANDQRIHDFIAKLEAYSDHLYCKRITITDMLLSLPGKITPPEKVPQDAKGFDAWSNLNCGSWAAEMQVKAYHAARGLEAGDRATFDSWMDDYAKWARPC